MQKRLGMVFLLAALCLGSAVPAHAWFVHRGFGRPGVVIVPRVVVPFGPYWASYPYPPAVVAAPPVYVQLPPVVAGQPPAAQYWYYCDNPQGYYPYVQQCPGGWRQVAPTPP